jgi:DHA3 family macrolide efflux protein-like MFS transporter
MRAYFIIWLGEVASTLGSALTSFALGLWIYEQTASVSWFTLSILSYTLPHLLMTPLAGVLADRWNRKWLIVLGDAGVALTTLGVFLLAASGHLRIGYVYALTVIAATFGALQWPAYVAAIPLIVPKDQLGRASALSQAGSALSEMLAPLLAGTLYGISAIGLRGILFIDFATFVFSTVTLLITPIPLHRRSIDSDAAPPTIWRDMLAGWQYIRRYPGLVGLLGYFAALNFFEEFMYPLAQPLLFNTTTPTGAGQAMSIMPIGMLVGIGVVGIGGGPKRHIHGILIPGILSGLVIAAAGLRPSITLITVAGFGYFALLPIIEASNQVLWQTKVAEDVQGRVFAMQDVIASSIGPVALLLAGPLADGVFEPSMQQGGLLADSVGQIIGVGPGRGLAYAHPRIRHVEDELPDTDGASHVDIVEVVQTAI